jgi:hypothetical protein
VQPELDKLGRIIEARRGRREQALEHVGEMAQVELIVEVLGGLSEASLYLLME